MTSQVSGHDVRSKNWSNFDFDYQVFKERRLSCLDKIFSFFCYHTNTKGIKNKIGYDIYMCMYT